jgi:hypothetical protein
VGRRRVLIGPRRRRRSVRSERRRSVRRSAAKCAIDERMCVYYRFVSIPTLYYAPASSSISAAARPLYGGASPASATLHCLRSQPQLSRTGQPSVVSSDSIPAPAPPPSATPPPRAAQPLSRRTASPWARAAACTLAAARRSTRPTPASASPAAGSTRATRRRTSQPFQLNLLASRAILRINPSPPFRRPGANSCWLCVEGSCMLSWGKKPWPLLRRLRQHNDLSSEDCRVRVQSRLYCGPVASVPYVRAVGGVRSSHS